MITLLVILALSAITSVMYGQRVVVDGMVTEWTGRGNEYCNQGTGYPSVDFTPQYDDGYAADGHDGFGRVDSADIPEIA